MKYLLLTSLILNLVASHATMEKPAIRGNTENWGFCDSEEGCPGPCETPKDKVDYTYRQKEVYQRGAKIPVEWKRLNHPGGFVRLAIVPTEQSDDKQAFDQNVYQYSCFESNCKQDDNIDDSFHGYMAGPNFANNHPQCSTEFVIPPHLEDGDYTLQWMWFSGGVNTGDRFRAFGNYYACADLKIRGGNKGEKPPVAFIGKDAVTEDPKQCRFWGKNDEYSCEKSYDASNPDKCPRGGPRLGAPSAFSVGISGEQSNRGIPFEAPEWYKQKYPQADVMPQSPVNWTPPEKYNPNPYNQGAPFIETNHNKQQNQEQKPVEQKPVEQQKNGQDSVWTPPPGYNPYAEGQPLAGKTPVWTPPPGYNPYGQN
ncbi:hypothetical protein K502DRAFT_317417 [Neoconidiobolus thromboides FSU 785]|nr:hypothetical protein K502DRAFT_317417 [Neoconidiobolus thromboides FSU 785]